MESKDLFPAQSTEDEIFAILSNEAPAIDNTESIIRKRIDQLGVAQPNVQKVSGGRMWLSCRASMTASEHASS